MNTPEIAEALHTLAREYLESEQQLDSFALSELLMRGAASTRFVAALVEQAEELRPARRGYYNTLGTAWLDAGRRFLRAVLEQADDEVHSSRVARRVEL